MWETQLEGGIISIELITFLKKLMVGKKDNFFNGTMKQLESYLLIG